MLEIYFWLNEWIKYLWQKQESSGIFIIVHKMEIWNAEEKVIWDAKININWSEKKWSKVLY